MRKNIIFLVLILIAISVTAFGADVTITTYYPAPYGVYKELRTDQVSVGSGYRNAALSDGRLIIEGRVGIGEINPSNKLEVQATTSTAIYAETSDSYGVYGKTTHPWTGAGVFGESTAGQNIGVKGWSVGYHGVHGYTRDNRTESAGVSGLAPLGACGVRGVSHRSHGVHGETWSHSSDDAGVYAYNTEDGPGVKAKGTRGWDFYGEGPKTYFSGPVGIGETSPDAKLEVAGQVKITGGSPGANKVLTSDANGLASWKSLAENWVLECKTIYPGASVKCDTVCNNEGGEWKCTCAFGSPGGYALACSSSVAGKDSICRCCRVKK